MDKFSLLTKRELDILKLLANGKRDKEIGAELSCHPRSISRRITIICEKIHANTRTHAAVMFALHVREE